MSSIYIAICSLEDSQIENTISDIFDNSSKENKIYVGLSLVCSEEYYEERKEFFSKYPNLTVEAHPEKIENLGLGVGRRRALKFYTNQDYFLQIDAHTKLEKDWDKFLIKSYLQAKLESNRNKFILCGWLGKYSYKPERYVLDARAGYPSYTLVPEKMLYSEKIVNAIVGLPWHTNSPILRSKDNFSRSVLYCGNFSFSEGTIVEDLLIAYKEDVVFLEEDVLFSIELYNLGYEFIYPNFDLPLTHSYNSKGHEMGGERKYLEMFVEEKNIFETINHNVYEYFNNEKNKEKITRYAEFANLLLINNNLLVKVEDHVPRWYN